MIRRCEAYSSGLAAGRTPIEIARVLQIPLIIEFRQYRYVIETFGNALAEDLYDDRRTKATRAFPANLIRGARRELLFRHEATDLRDLGAPWGNRLERLKGDRKGFHSIRINDQWRLVLRWSRGNAFGVQIVGYH